MNTITESYGDGEKGEDGKARPPYPCRDDEILDLDAYEVGGIKCISLKSVEGLQMLDYYQRRKSSLVGDIHKNFGINILNNISSEYYISDYIASGSFASVFLLCTSREDNCNRVIRLEKLRAQDRRGFMKQQEIINKFEAIKLAPTVFSHRVIKIADNTPKIQTNAGFEYIGIDEMEKIDGILQKALVGELPIETLDSIYLTITQTIERLAEHMLVHGDFHQTNIGFIGNSVRLIDFQYSHEDKNAKSNPLDMAGMLMMFHEKHTNHENLKYLRPKLLEFFNQRYPKYAVDVYSQKYFYDIYMMFRPRIHSRVGQ
jgi:tRNA A-37 threonylcarbamoyl transferase component Bud32